MTVSGKAGKILKPRISIITVAYNSEATIKRTIESVLRQTYHEFEYLIIDGASKDKTVEVAKSYEQAFHDRGIDYQIFSEPDHGIYDAMNKGILKADGSVIGIINSDDWYEDNALELAASVFDNEQCDLMYADIRIMKQNGTSFIKKARHRKFMTSRDWNHPTTFVKAELYRESPFVCKGIHDDYGFFLKMNREKRKIIVLNEVLADFVMGGTSNQKSLRASRRRIRDRYRCYRENGYSRFYMVECILMEFVKLLT